MACTSLLGSGIFTITDANSQSIALCPGFFALRQNSAVLVSPRGARQYDATEWNIAATSVIFSLVSLANPQGQFASTRSHFLHPSVPLPLGKFYANKHSPPTYTRDQILWRSRRLWNSFSIFIVNEFYCSTGLYTENRSYKA